jgi:hypothetical protein
MDDPAAEFRKLLRQQARLQILVALRFGKVSWQKPSQRPNASTP